MVAYALLVGFPRVKQEQHTVSWKRKAIEVQSLGLKFRTVGFDIFRLISNSVSLSTPQPGSASWFCLMRHAGDVKWTRNHQLVLGSFRRDMLFIPCICVVVAGPELQCMEPWGTGICQF